MKKVCIITKFPPVQGGVAARAYWRVRELLDDGAKVAVITSTGCGQLELAGTSTSYLIKECNVLPSIPNSKRDRFSYYDIDRTSVPWRVQESPDYLERLLSQTLLVLQEDEWNYIESDYLVPYGIVGHFVSKITGIPHILRHGASDIGKYLSHELYNPMLCEVLRGATTVITDVLAISSLSKNVEREYEIAPVYVPNAEAFCQDDAKKQRDIAYAFIGKVNYHWSHKALDEIVKKYTPQIKEKKLRFFAQGKGAPDFVAWAKKNHDIVIKLEGFVSPWEMPRLLSRIDTILIPKQESHKNEWGTINTSMLSIEAELMGCKILEI